MRELALNWYILLSTLNATVSGPLSGLVGGLGVPAASALLFGLIGTTAPCQVTTNASALAYLVRLTGDRRSVVSSALSYVGGKALVYTVLGMAAILAGRQFAQSTIPAIEVIRKALGPLMLLIGLYFIGLIPLRFGFGQGLAAWVKAQVGPGAGGAFLLGSAFALAFCPTLFLLFFGLTIPLALSSPAGIFYPGVFALGTTLPLLALITLFIAGMGGTKGYLAGMRSAGIWLNRGAGVLLVLVGLNDTFTYWFL